MASFSDDYETASDDFDSDHGELGPIYVPWSHPTSAINRGNSKMQPATTTDSSFGSLPVSADARSMVKGGSPAFTPLSPLDPKGVVNFFNTLGIYNFLYVRILWDHIFEANSLFGIAKETPENPINYWRAATAIKNGVPFRLYSMFCIGFLFGPDTSVGIASIPQKTGTTVETPAWGKGDLGSDGYKGLDTNGKITVTHNPEHVEKNPIGEKLEEIRKRISGEWPDLSTKELYAFLYGLYNIVMNDKLLDEQKDTEIRDLFAKIKGLDLSKLLPFPIKDIETAIRVLAPKISTEDLNELASLMSETDIAKGIKVLAPNITDHDLKDFVDLRKKLDEGASFKRKDSTKKPKRYSRSGDLLDCNEVLIHPTKENCLGIVVCIEKLKEKAIKIQKHIEENGGQHLPIFLYDQNFGNLTLLEA